MPPTPPESLPPTPPKPSTSPLPPSASPAPALDSAAVHTWCGLALDALGAERAELDAINVFPVADGDTGTNLWHTLEAARHALEGAGATTATEPAPGGRPAGGEPLRAAARGALLGACGNSGTILAQYLRGFAEGLETAEGADALRCALRRAAAAAREAVAQPVEGTMLTVASAAASAVSATRPAYPEPIASMERPASADLAEPREPAEGGQPGPPVASGRVSPGSAAGSRSGSAGSVPAGTVETPGQVVRAAHEAALAALAQTTGQLEPLATAGVVDAGGRGLAAVLGALAATLDGGSARSTPGWAVPSPEAPESSAASGVRPVRPSGELSGPGAGRGACGAEPSVEAAPARARSVASGMELGVPPSDGPAAATAYEVMYLLRAEDAAVSALRTELDALGDSVVVAGGDGVWSVHVHTDEVGAAIEAGLAVGRPERMRVSCLRHPAPAQHAPGETAAGPRTSRAGRPGVAEAPERGADGRGADRPRHPAGEERRTPHGAGAPVSVGAGARETQARTGLPDGPARADGPFEPTRHGGGPAGDPPRPSGLASSSAGKAAPTGEGAAPPVRSLVAAVPGDGLAELYAAAGAAVVPIAGERAGAAGQTERGGTETVLPVPEARPDAATHRSVPAHGDTAAHGGVHGAVHGGADEKADAQGEADAEWGGGRLLSALLETGAREAVLLPNTTGSHRAAARAAERARELGVRVAVIPTRSPVQGIAALAVHEPDRRFDEDVVAMTSAAGATRYGEVTFAEHRSWTMAGVCEAGDVLGLVDGDVAAIGSPDAIAATVDEPSDHAPPADPPRDGAPHDSREPASPAASAGTPAPAGDTAGAVERMAVEVLARMLSGGGELVTLVLGQRAPAGMVERLEEYVRHRHLGASTVVYEGRQRHAPLLIGVE